MIAVAAPPSRTGWAAPRSLRVGSGRPLVLPGTLRLPGGWPTGRRQPSAAVRRRRAVVALVAIAVCGLLLGVGSLAGAGQPPAPVQPAVVIVDATPVAAATHLVQPGDTLWSVARRLQPDGDVRPLVARLRAAAGGSQLVPGQRLLLAV